MEEGGLSGRLEVTHIASASYALSHPAYPLPHWRVNPMPIAACPAMVACTPLAPAPGPGSRWAAGCPRGVRLGQGLQALEP